MKTLINIHTQKQIDLAITSNQQAIGLRGEKGAGKAHIASWTAARMLNSPIDKINDHPHLLRVHNTSQKTGIDAIRQLQTFLQLKVPSDQDINRVVIIEDFDTLRLEAQNALLKTIEEPPFGTSIIITYSRQDLVLPTILSRLRIIEVLPIEEQQYKELGLYNDSDLIKSYAISGGLAGTTLAILAKSDNDKTVEYINKAKELINLPRYERLSRVDKLVKDKNLDIIMLVEGIYKLVHASYNSYISQSKIDKKQLKVHINRLELLGRSLTDLKENVQPKIVLNQLFLSM